MALARWAAAGNPKHPIRQRVFAGVYLGRPSIRPQPGKFRDHEAMIKRWDMRHASDLTVQSHPLSYSYWPPREKGIDVMLATDALMAAALDRDVRKSLKRVYDMGQRSR